MKNIKKISSFILLISALYSCSYESEINTIKTTYYPVFENTNQVVIPLGGTYTADGIAKEQGVQIPVTIDGAENVDTNTVGVYNVTYSAINKDGFAASVVETVIVHDPSIVGTDVSGEIQDANNTKRTGTISLVEGTTSIFFASDFGFSGVFPMYFQMNGDTASEINQQYSLDVTQVSISYNTTDKKFSVGPIVPYGFSYTFEYTN
jgi:hypothetical protein